MMYIYIIIIAVYMNDFGENVDIISWLTNSVYILKP